jgi:2-keto-4-pentenoate hydratase
MAAARRAPLWTASAFKTGNTPGKPLQTGQILVLGSASQESALQEQKILVSVFNWMCVSNPMITS